MSTLVEAEEYLIKTSNIDAVMHEIQIKILDTISDASVYLIETDEAEEKLKQIVAIEKIEKNKTIQLPITIPQQFYSLQVSEDWGFNYLHLSSLAYGEKPVRVGLLDTGVDTDHPFLLPYLDEGYTMYPYEGVNDLNGHGTGIAGLIVNQSPTSLRLVPIKVMNQYGRGTSYSVIEGLYQAIKVNVDVVNLSLGSIYQSSILHEAIELVLDANIIIVAAAGNFGGEGALYPARYLNVIGVGALDESGTVSSFSQYGEGIDIYVPGEKLLTTALNGAYSLKSGTSFASGYVSKAIAFLKMHHDLPNHELLSMFKESLILHNDIPQLSISRLNYQALSYEAEEIQHHMPNVTIDDLQKQWTIHFSKNVSPASITPRSIYIKGNQEIIESIVIVNEDAVTVSPAKPLIPGNTYDLIITNNVTSNTGEKLRESVLKRFTIELGDDDD